MLILRKRQAALTTFHGAVPLGIGCHFWGCPNNPEICVPPVQTHSQVAEEDGSWMLWSLERVKYCHKL